MLANGKEVTPGFLAHHAYRPIPGAKEFFLCTIYTAAGSPRDITVQCELEKLAIGIAVRAEAAAPTGAALVAVHWRVMGAHNSCINALPKEQQDAIETLCQYHLLNGVAENVSTFDVTIPAEGDDNAASQAAH